MGTQWGLRGGHLGRGAWEGCTRWGFGARAKRGQHERMQMPNPPSDTDSGEITVVGEGIRAVGCGTRVQERIEPRGGPRVIRPEWACCDRIEREARREYQSREEGRRRRPSSPSLYHPRVEVKREPVGLGKVASLFFCAHSLCCLSCVYLLLIEF